MAAAGCADRATGAGGGARCDRCGLESGLRTAQRIPCHVRAPVSWLRTRRTPRSGVLPPRTARSARTPAAPPAGRPRRRRPRRSPSPSAAASTAPGPLPPALSAPEAAAAPNAGGAACGRTRRRGRRPHSVTGSAAPLIPIGAALGRSRAWVTRVSAACRGGSRDRAHVSHGKRQGSPVRCWGLIRR